MTRDAERLREALVLVLDKYATDIFIASRDDTDPPSVDRASSVLAATICEVLGVTEQGVSDLRHWSGVENDNWRGMPQRDGMHAACDALAALLEIANGNAD